MTNFLHFISTGQTKKAAKLFTALCLFFSLSVHAKNSRHLSVGSKSLADRSLLAGSDHPDAPKSGGSTSSTAGNAETDEGFASSLGQSFSDFRTVLTCNTDLSINESLSRQVTSMAMRLRSKFESAFNGSQPSTGSASSSTTSTPSKTIDAEQLRIMLDSQLSEQTLGAAAKEHFLGPFKEYVNALQTAFVMKAADDDKDRKKAKEAVEGAFAKLQAAILENKNIGAMLLEANKGKAQEGSNSTQASGSAAPTATPSADNRCVQSADNLKKFQSQQKQSAVASSKSESKNFNGAASGSSTENTKSATPSASKNKASGSRDSSDSSEQTSSTASTIAAGNGQMRIPSSSASLGSSTASAQGPTTDSSQPSDNNYDSDDGYVNEDSYKSGGSASSPSSSGPSEQNYAEESASATDRVGQRLATDSGASGSSSGRSPASDKNNLAGQSPDSNSPNPKQKSQGADDENSPTKLLATKEGAKALRETVEDVQNGQAKGVELAAAVDRALAQGVSSVEVTKALDSPTEAPKILATLTQKKQIQKDAKSKETVKSDALFALPSGEKEALGIWTGLLRTKISSKSYNPSRDDSLIRTSVTRIDQTVKKLISADGKIPVASKPLVCDLAALMTKASAATSPNVYESGYLNPDIFPKDTQNRLRSIRKQCNPALAGGA